jgi:hypothetical protein
MKTVTLSLIAAGMVSALVSVTVVRFAKPGALRDGKEAGLDAYREVETMIDAAGHHDRPLGERARNRIADLPRRIAAGGQPR